MTLNGGVKLQTRNIEKARRALGFGFGGLDSDSTNIQAIIPMSHKRPGFPRDLPPNIHLSSLVHSGITRPTRISGFLDVISASLQ